MKNEILNVDAEDLSLESQIDNALQKENITDKVIGALKKKYGSLKLKSLDDKEGYLILKESRKEVRKVGIIAEKICEAGRSDAVKIQKLWLNKQKQVLGQIAEVQDPLDAEIKKFEDEEARIKELEIQRQEEQFMQRQTALLKMEAVYGNNCLVLGSVSYEIQNIKEADEEIWTDTILPKYQREFAKVEEEKALIEKQKKEAEEKLRLEQEELKKQQDELNKQREEMRLQQEQLDKQKIERERQLLQEEQNRNEEIRAAKELVYKERQRQLLELGLKFGGTSFSISSVAGAVEITTEDITSKEVDAWALFIESKKALIEEAKSNIARFQQEETQRIQQEAAQKERERIEEEQKLLKIKEEQEEAQRQEEFAKASDKEKWAAFVEVIGRLLPPTTMKSGVYKSKSSLAVQKLNEIKNL